MNLMIYAIWPSSERHEPLHCEIIEECMSWYVRPVKCVADRAAALSVIHSFLGSGSSELVWRPTIASDGV